MTFPENNIGGKTDPELREMLNVRDAAIIGRYRNGERASVLGREYGLTRERVRQILEGALGRREKKKLMMRNRKVRRLSKLLGKPAVLPSHLRDVAGVVSGKPGSSSVADVREQRPAKPAE